MKKTGKTLIYKTASLALLLSFISYPALSQDLSSDFFSEEDDVWSDLGGFDDQFSAFKETKDADSEKVKEKIEIKAEPKKVEKEERVEKPEDKKPEIVEGPPAPTQQPEKVEKEVVDTEEDKTQPVQIQETAQEGPPFDAAPKFSESREDFDIEYKPSGTQVRKTYDYRKSPPPAVLQKKEFDSANSHLPKTFYQKEYSELLFIAAVQDDIGAINGLLKRGANINSQSLDNGYTPLMYAVKEHNIRTIRYLLTRGADVNAKAKDGKTVLHIAAIQNQIDVIEILLKVGAEASITDLSGKTAFEYVHPASREKFAIQIAKVHSDPEKSLLNFVNTGDVSAVQYLIDSGADLNTKSPNGDTPLMLAVRNQNATMVSLLLSKGSSIQPLNNDGLDAFQIALQSGNSHIAKIIDTVAIHRELESGVSTKTVKGKKPKKLSVEELNSIASAPVLRHEEVRQATAPSSRKRGSLFSRIKDKFQFGSKGPLKARTESSSPTPQKRSRGNIFERIGAKFSSPSTAQPEASTPMRAPVQSLPWQQAEQEDRLSETRKDGLTSRIGDKLNNIFSFSVREPTTEEYQPSSEPSVSPDAHTHGKIEEAELPALGKKKEINDIQDLKKATKSQTPGSNLFNKIGDSFTNIFSSSPTQPATKHTSSVRQIHTRDTSRDLRSTTTPAPKVAADPKPWKLAPQEMKPRPKAKPATKPYKFKVPQKSTPIDKKGSSAPVDIIPDSIQ